MYKKRVFLVENLSPLHVGSGEANFGVIDNMVQRDEITEYPIIHSSSLKGALREFSEYMFNMKNEHNGGLKNFLGNIFGDEDKSGNVKFLDAHLIALPLRAETTSYVMGVSADSIKNFVEMTTRMGVKLDINLEEFTKDVDSIISNIQTNIEDTNTIVEDKNWEVLQKFLDEENIAIIPNQKFKEYVKELPVIARNQLENGTSKNLFYEEIVPRKSKFFTIMMFPEFLNEGDRDVLTSHYDKFLEYITLSEVLPQIGANASIGYGICRFKELV
jgi:CRISPR-associated protein Cmr4